MKVNTSIQQYQAQLLQNGPIAANLLSPKGTTGSNPMDRVDLTGEVSAEWIYEVLSSEIGKKVDAMLGEQGIEPLSMADLDLSPDATAGRIFDFTTAFYGMYRAQNEEMTEEEAITGFEKLMRGAVDKGAAQAMGILESYSLNGNPAVNTAKETMSILHGMYDDFFAELREGLANTEKDENIETRPEVGD